MVIVVVSLGTAGAFAFNYLTNPPVNPSVRSTFQEYGITIQYPSRATMATKGLTAQTADSGQGRVSWSWNDNLTSLFVSWGNTSYYNYTVGFNGIYSRIKQDSSNYTLLVSGTTQLDGHVWPYQTYRFNLNGTTFYVTYAISFYSSEGRVYLIAFDDIAPDTLNNLDSFGSTFHA